MKAFISIKNSYGKDALFEVMKAFISIKSLSSEDVFLDNKWLSFKTVLHKQLVFLN